jgi:predicted negative regulator of RcsB-dependent stress response
VSDYLSEEEQVAALKKWWDEYGKVLIAGAVIAILGVVGWRVYQDHSQGQAEAAAALFQVFEEQRQAEAPDPNELARVAEALERHFSGSAYHPFVLFHQAADAVNAEDFDLGIEHLSTAVETADDARLRDMARIRLARTLQQIGDSEQALVTLGGVRGEGFFAEVAELKGDILVAGGDRAGAAQAYEAARATAGGARSPLLELKLLDMAETGAADTQAEAVDETLQ